ncbi:GNAT family N-acetyltransferase [Ruminococcaceae bacterium OttesenSCG-928-I18]|nr:GNAT family N-acetyltransferase [Ruminococcaceae bacterium OttesenSCG-928-I18]
MTTGQPVIQTRRLYLREMDEADLPTLRRILQDRQTMRAWQHAFSEEEVRAWLSKQRSRYEEFGYGLWAVCEKAGGSMVGQCGLSWQKAGEDRVLEVGYLLQRDHWHKGYALEAARACKEYAFGVLDQTEVFSLIWDENIASMNVAIRNGMLVRGRFLLHYWGADLPHLIFSARREDVAAGVE